MRFKSVFVSLFIALGLVATAIPAQAGRGPVPPRMGDLAAPYDNNLESQQRIS
jgi:hypothetical protein